MIPPRISLGISLEISQKYPTFSIKNCPRDCFRQASRSFLWILEILRTGIRNYIFQGLFLQILSHESLPWFLQSFFQKFQHLVFEELLQRFHQKCVDEFHFLIKFFRKSKSSSRDPEISSWDFFRTFSVGCVKGISCRSYFEDSFRHFFWSSFIFSKIKTLDQSSGESLEWALKHLREHLLDKSLEQFQDDSFEELLQDDLD